MPPVRTLAGIALIVATTASAQEVLTSLSAVRSLPVEKAAAHLPVQLEATVTLDNRDDGGIFIHDGTEGIFLNLPQTIKTNLTVHPGDRLKLKALTVAGDYMPALICESLAVTGSGALPQATSVTPQNLFSPNLDCQWVRMGGMITSVEADEKQWLVFTLEYYGWNLKVLTPWSEAAVLQSASLLQQRVTFQGICAETFNRQRQMTDRYFYTPALSFIQPDGSQNENPPETLSVDRLLRSDTASENRVRVQGIVTQSKENDLYLRGDGGSLRVRVAQGKLYQPGDWVEVEGFAAIAPFRPIFRASQVTRKEHHSIPAPLVLPLAATNLHYFQAELITLQAEYLGGNADADTFVLHCRREEQFFEGILPKSAALPDGLSPGCRVQLTGICELTTTRSLPRAEWVSGFQILLQATDDVRVIQRANWWTAGRLMNLLTVAGGLGIAAAIWIVLLQRRVLAKTKIIGSQLQREATLNERQRIARDLHDTVQQQMIGVSLQLDHVANRLEHKPDQAEAALQLARQMARHCREETSNAIRDLRSIILEQHGLAGALREILPTLMFDSRAKLIFDVQGTPTPLDAVIEAHLLRLIQEAVTNAARHAAAAEIKVAIHYQPNSVTLTVTDDGRGFDSKASPLDGHFGLLGMSERANKMNAALVIDSARGKGTTVQVTVLKVQEAGTALMRH